MDILKKSLAPITDHAWEEINETAKEVLETHLTARRFVDVNGPKGWDYPAEPTGRLKVSDKQKADGVPYGIHLVKPLVEPRITFELDIWELDNIARGAEDADLENLEKAAKSIAKFEENAVYYGLKNADIIGIKESSAHPVMKEVKSPDAFLEAVTDALVTMNRSNIMGPFKLIAGEEYWKMLSNQAKGYPLKKHLERLIDGTILQSPCIKETFLVAARGGDFKLTLGQDISIGYEGHRDGKVRLFFTESFTFQVIEPAAVVVLQ